VKLTVTGFQSHANTTLDLRENFICVVGANNIGKSALIRAVSWLLYDAMRGSKFIKKGRKQASVKLQIEETIVERLKGSGLNAYVINGKQLDAIKTGVPPEVVEALGTQAVQVDKDLILQLNIVKQTDDPFLMNETGTTRAKILNALTGHHILDVAIRNTVADSRKLQSEQKHLSTRRDQLTDDLKAFSGLANQEKRVAEARKHQNRLEELVRTAKRGRELLEAHQDAVKRRLEAHKLSETQLPQVDRLWSRAEAALRRQEVMEEALRRHQDAVDARSTASTLPEGPLAALEGLWRRAEVLKAKKTGLAEVVAAKERLAYQEGNLNLHTNQLSRLMEQFKLLKGTLCPTCSQPISEQCLEGLT